MKLIKYILVILFFSHCSVKTPEQLIGKWRVEGFKHSLDEFNDAQRIELEKRAKSTTYEFKTDFSVRVTSGFSKSSKTGRWYWDPYRKKLVIDNNSVLEENTDSIFIHSVSDDRMIWMQTFSQLDTSYVHLKRVE